MCSLQNQSLSNLTCIVQFHKSLFQSLFQFFRSSPGWSRLVRTSSKQYWMKLLGSMLFYRWKIIYQASSFGKQHKELKFMANRMLK